MREPNDSVTNFVLDLGKIEIWKYIYEEKMKLFYLKKVIQKEMIMAKGANKQNDEYADEDEKGTISKLKTYDNVATSTKNNIKKSKLSFFLNSPLSYDNYFNLRKTHEKEDTTLIKEKGEIINGKECMLTEKNEHNVYKSTNSKKKNTGDMVYLDHIEMTITSRNSNSAEKTTYSKNSKDRHKSISTETFANKRYEKLGIPPHDDQKGEKMDTSTIDQHDKVSTANNFTKGEFQFLSRVKNYEKEKCNEESNFHFVKKDTQSDKKKASHLRKGYNPPCCQEGGHVKNRNKISFHRKNLFEDSHTRGMEENADEHDNLRINDESCRMKETGEDKDNYYKATICAEDKKENYTNYEKKFGFKNGLRERVIFPSREKHTNIFPKGSDIHLCKSKSGKRSNIKKDDNYDTSFELRKMDQYSTIPVYKHLDCVDNVFVNMSLEQKKTYFVENNRKVNNIIRDEVARGIPDNVRGFAWQILVQSYTYREYIEKSIIGNPCARRTYCSGGEGVYRYYLGIGNKYENVIKKDINRTYPKHILFKNNYEKGQNILFNVLKAYSNYNKDLGYCQGMAFIVATFILYMNEEDAFFMLIALLDKYKLTDLFSSDMPLLNEYLYILDQLLFHMFPRIYNHLQKENVHCSMYASQWFITLFSYNINILYAIRIWDFFFIHNYTFLFKIALAFFKLQEDVILTESFEEILNRLKILSKHVQLDVLIQTALELKIKNSLISKISADYRSRR
ncbi:GTPase-activating protein, putative [Plasmodium ovale curtisi]|uniref:GTPase-activating protein, putative n=1 Tax=Plasmodium ovale curtisi TaxID=864141 RepID=A0A1A8W2F5_PLAOA|nr:GTPase-activating protein, putative [Plasmodium ovale curtisi]